MCVLFIKVTERRKVCIIPVYNYYAQHTHQPLVGIDTISAYMLTEYMCGHNLGQVGFLTMSVGEALACHIHSYRQLLLDTHTYSTNI